MNMPQRQQLFPRYSSDLTNPAFASTCTNGMFPDIIPSQAEIDQRITGMLLQSPIDTH